MSQKQSKFSKDVIKELKFYVYIYSHPKTNEIFYVGKGKGNRVFHHLDDKSESDKAKYISELRKNGLKPNIEILIHGIEDENTALRVEASIIDLLGIKNLSNKQSGYKSSTFGRMTIDQLKSTYEKQTIDIDDNVMLIRINQAFSYSMPPIELYDYTRGHWRLNPERAKKADFVFAVYHGIIQEVYEVVDWFVACKTYSSRQGNERIKRKSGDKLDGRFEFVGNIAPEEIRKKYKYKSVEHYFKRGNSNPIMYVNI